jgi:hypothetical protein
MAKKIKNFFLLTKLTNCTIIVERSKIKNKGQKMNRTKQSVNNKKQAVRRLKSERGVM